MVESILMLPVMIFFKTWHGYFLIPKDKIFKSGLPYCQGIIFSIFCLFADCYENNDPTTNRKANTTTEFEKRWNQTMTCFKGFLKPDDLSPEMTLADLVTEHDIKDKILCQNCSEVYNSLRNFFWEKVVPSNPEGILSGVCYDIRDRFNLTGQIWKETFDCEPMPESWKFLLPGIVFTIFIIMLTYVCEPKILPYFFPSKIEQTVALGKIYWDFAFCFSFACCLYLFV